MTMSLYFTDDHQWVKLHDDGVSATVGISTHAQEVLGDVVFVDLPAIGASFEQLTPGATVESVKAAADVLMPVSGTVTAVNEDLKADPSLANTDPMGAGWFMRIQIDSTKTASELTKLTPENAYNP